MSEHEREARWAAHTQALRDPQLVTAWWEDAGTVDEALLEVEISDAFRGVLARLDVTLLATREYEHLVVALTADGEPSHLRLPHPSGLAVDRARGRIQVAATRNPNQLVELAPLEAEGRPLVPVRARMLPGALYLHDLAYVGGALHGNAVGQDAVVALSHDDWPGWERAWAPSVTPASTRNHLQLNSIAAGATLADSFFSASVAAPGDRFPGDPEWEVDGRGVVFSGATGEVVATGLTRPHSARLHDGRVWVDNSGYGEVGRLDGGRFEAVAKLPGWTRGLCFCGDVAFVATSRVIPRFARYAPGLDVAASRCAVHALDVSTGAVLGSAVWPAGNQIFAVETVPSTFSLGFPARSGAREGAVSDLFSQLPLSAERPLDEQ